MSSISLIRQECLDLFLSFIQKNVAFGIRDFFQSLLRNTFSSSHDTPNVHLRQRFLRNITANVCEHIFIIKTATVVCVNIPAANFRISKIWNWTVSGRNYIISRKTKAIYLTAKIKFAKATSRFIKKKPFEYDCETFAKMHNPSNFTKHRSLGIVVLRRWAIISWSLDFFRTLM